MITPRTLRDINAIPRDLWPHTQFVCWRYIDTGRKKPAKRPINPHTLGNAGVEWPNTWSGIHTAVETYKRHAMLSGIGFMLTPDDPFVFMDIDGCILGNQLSPLAVEIVNTLATYTEVSPSGTGLRLLIHCTDTLPPNRKLPGLELYSMERYCTLTGNVWGNARPITRIGDLNNIMRHWLSEDKTGPTVFCEGPQYTPSPDDADLWQRIFDHNQIASRLYHGDLSVVYGQAKAGGPDTSRAVILLLNCLAYWTGGDHVRMARMIRQASIDQSKFDERRGAGCWLDYQIADAINYTAGRR